VNTLDIRILVVDDDFDIARGTSRVLEQAGYTTVIVLSGSGALASLNSSRPDLVLLDRDLPDTDGMELCRQIKSDPTLADIFVILISGTYTRSEEQLSGLQAGADGYLVRPIVNCELAVRVEAYVRIVRLSRALRKKSTELEASNQSLRQFHFAALNLMEDAVKAKTSAETALAALHESERQLSTLMPHLPGMVYRCRNLPDWPMEFVSEGCATLTGWPPDALMQQHPAYGELIVASDRQRVWDAVQAAIAIFQPFELNYQIQAADGQIKWVWERGCGIFGEDGGLLFLEGFITDISDSKKAQEELERQRTELQFIFDAVPALIFYKDRQHRILRVNRALAKLIGEPKGVLESRTAEEYGSPYAEQYRRDDEEVFSTGQPKRGLIEPLQTVQGIRWLQTDKLPYRDASGQIVGLIGFSLDITERKHSEESLHACEDRFRRALLNSPFPILLHAEDGQILQVSHSWCEITGYTREELQTINDWTERAYGERKDLVIADIDALYALDNRKYEGDYIIRIKDGTTRIWDFSSAPLGRLPDGRRLVISMALDVTERRRAEAEVERTAQQWQTTFDATNDAIWILDKDHRVLRSNRTAERFFHRPCFEMLGQHCWVIVHGTADPHPECPFVRARQSGRRESMEFKFGELWMEVAVDPILDATGHYIGAVHIVSDITEQKRAMEKLLASERKYRELVENANSIILRWNPQGQISFMNEFGQRFFGYEEDEILNRNVVGTIVPETESTGRDLRPLMKHICENPAAFEQNINENILRDGRRVWVAWTNKTVFDAEGKPVEILSIGTDISERRRTEQELIKQAALLDAANEAIYVRTLDNMITFWNSGAERLYGWSRTEALGRRITELGGVDQAAFMEAHAELVEQGHWSGELTKTSKAGNECVIFCRWTVLRDAQGKLSEILAINTDITEKKKLESQFLRAQRMESIGSLAGGIAHDLNNILSPILMTMPLLSEAVGDAESRQMIDTVTECTKRGADIIKQLLTFARGKPGARVPLPVRHLMREMDKLIRETFPRNIQLSVNFAEDLWPVLGDATQIHQAIVNLCVNARDAMPDGGKLILAARNATIDETFAAMTPNAEPGKYVCLCVTDTGSGIPPENIDKIFEPFFTTKEIGKGTGLGLATVLGIVHGHDGFACVNSRWGKGTTIELYLLAKPEATVSAMSDIEMLLPRGKGELILVVDDEKVLQMVMRNTLEKYGYRVLSASEGVEALALFNQYRTEVKVVITDMMMPGMDGPNLVRTLRHMDARLPIIGMTGLIEQGGIKGLMGLLPKPFTSVELLAALSQALARSRPESRTPDTEKKISYYQGFRKNVFKICII